MRLAAIVLVMFLFAGGTASAQNAGELKAVKNVNLRFQVLLYQLYELSNWNPPPGTNAASGVWRDKIVADEKIKNVGVLPAEGMTGDAGKLAQVYNEFYAKTVEAFSANENVESTWAGKGIIFRSILGKAGEKVYGISFDIYQSAGGDETENKKFATEARNSARALIRTIDRNGPIYKGAHAAPQIAVSEYNAANAALQKLDQLFGGDYSGAGGPAARVLKQVFTEITTMPTVTETPWLLPSWQIQFQYVCLTGSIVMEKVSPPESE